MDRPQIALEGFGVFPFRWFAQVLSSLDEIERGAEIQATPAIKHETNE